MALRTKTSAGLPISGAGLSAALTCAYRFRWLVASHHQHPNQIHPSLTNPHPTFFLLSISPPLRPMTIEEKINATIVGVPNFPKEGIIYKDITPIFQDPALSKLILAELVNHYKSYHLEAVLGLESRGFLFGMPLALELGIPFILVRKKGKLPRSTYSVSYDLEYGQATIEMHTDALKPGQKVLIHDDVLATGGTASAAAELVLQAGAEITAFSFLIELGFLNGRKTLEKYSTSISTFANC
jgi:adenine phosphoribosyltransferase